MASDVLISCILGLVLLIDVAFSKSYKSTMSTRHEEIPKQAIACEGSTLTIECNNNQLIRIVRASYGRLKYDICYNGGDTEQWNLGCMSTRSLDVVTEFCDGKRECWVPATNRMFGDPCPLSPKYLDVQYQCRQDQVKPVTRPQRPTTTSTTTSTTTTTTTQPPTTTTMTTTESTTTTSTTTSTTTTPAPRAPEPEDVLTTTAWEETTWEEDNSNLPPATAPPMGYFCEPLVYRNVSWPRTLAGMEAVRPCPSNSHQMATWTCGDYPVMWKGLPSLKKCVSEETEELMQMVSSGMPAAYVSSSMSSASEHIVYGGDIDQISSTMKDLVTSLEEEIELIPMEQAEDLVESVNTEMVRTGSNLLTANAAWDDLSSEFQSDKALEVVEAVEESAFQVAKVIRTPLAVPILRVEINIVMEINVVDTSEEAFVEDVVFPNKERMATHEKWQNSGDCIRLSGSTIRELGVDGLAKLIFFTYDNLEHLLQPQVQADDSNSIIKPSLSEPSITVKKYPKSSSLDPMENEVNEHQSIDLDPIDLDYEHVAYKPEDEFSNEIPAVPPPPKKDDNRGKIVNSNIISASVNQPTGVNNLQEPVIYTLKHKTTENVYNPSCSFWDYSERIQDGSWSSFGCKVRDTNMTHTECECNHLTNFAVLMDVVGVQLAAHHVLALTSITYVGCIISIVCLFLSWITFTICRNLQCDRNTIHKHLVFNLFVAEIIFLCGIAAYEYQALCSVIAGFLHYFFLAAFAWMCLEGVQLYVMLVEVFEAEKSRRNYYYMAAYGAPALIVAVSAGVHPEGYGTQSYCWLDVSNGFIWAFVLPVVLVVTVNIVMLSIAIYVMCKHANVAAKLKMKERTRAEKISAKAIHIGSWVKGSLVLVVLLGLTWGVGLLYVNQHSVAMAYIFTILNTMQGFFIFLFHCVMDERVQKEYKRYVRRATWLPECLRVSYGGAPASTYSTPSNSSAGNYLQKLWSSRRRRRSSTSTSIPRSSSTPLTKSGLYQNPNSQNRSSGGSFMNNSRSSGGSYPAFANQSLLESTGEPIYDAQGYLEPASVRSSLMQDSGVQGQNLSTVESSVIDTEGLSDYCQNGGLAINVDKYKIGSPKLDDVNEECDYKSPLNVPRMNNLKDCESDVSDDDSIKKRPLSWSSDDGTLELNQRPVSWSSQEDTLDMKKRPLSWASSQESLNDLNKGGGDSPRGSMNLSTPNICGGASPRGSMNLSTPNICGGGTLELRGVDARPTSPSSHSRPSNLSRSNSAAGSRPQSPH